MQYEMISYVILLKRYPETCNKKPLGYISLASQKNNISLYLSNIYGDPDLAKWFYEEYKKSGKRMDIGKSCVRGRNIEDYPLDLIAEAVGKMSVEEYIKVYEDSRKETKNG